MDDLDTYLQVCEEAVRAGGRVVQDWSGRFDVHTKGPADLVTQADLESQQIVRQIVLGAFPDHCLLGEETDPGDEETAKWAVPCPPAQEWGQSPTETAARAEYRWIVDPLDGTTNYVHGVPHYGVSLALERNGELLVGAVYDPVLDECFLAARGRGARLNGRPIHTSRTVSLAESLAAVGFPPNVRPDAPDFLVFLEMLPRCQAIRRSGSSALNLCYLAAGRFDLYWAFATHIWDVAAGVLLVREAGGCVTAPDGGAFVLEDARFLAAANAEILRQMRAVVAKSEQQRSLAQRS
jgi:myo-inositol-1(or 4)-monophosphatase